MKGIIIYFRVAMAVALAQPPRIFEPPLKAPDDPLGHRLARTARQKVRQFARRLHTRSAFTKHNHLSLRIKAV